MALVLHHLPQMPHARRWACPAHDLRVQVVDPEAAVGVDVALEILDLLGGLAVAAAVEGETVSSAGVLLPAAAIWIASPGLAV